MPQKLFKNIVIIRSIIEFSNIHYTDNKYKSVGIINTCSTFSVDSQIIRFGEYDRLGYIF